MKTKTINPTREEILAKYDIIVKWGIVGRQDSLLRTAEIVRGD